MDCAFALRNRIVNWEAFSAIFQAIGAIATASAVGVALWATGYNNRKKLKLVFSLNSHLYGREGILLDCVSLSVANTGNRSITIRQWGYSYAKHKNVVVLPDPEDKLLSLINTTLPKTTQPEEAIDLALKTIHMFEDCNRVIEKDSKTKNNRITVFVIDSTGKIYKKRTQYTVNQVIEQLRPK